jgi:hypothetical protein
MGLEEHIEELAPVPRRTVTDEGTVVERSMAELIEADKYLKAVNVGDQPLHGLRVSRCKSAGPA